MKYRVSYTPDDEPYRVQTWHDTLTSAVEHANAMRAAGLHDVDIYECHSWGWKFLYNLSDTRITPLIVLG